MWEGHSAAVEGTSVDTHTSGFASTVGSKPTGDLLRLGKQQKPESLAVECGRLEGKVVGSLCEQPSNLYFPLLEIMVSQITIAF